MEYHEMLGHMNHKLESVTEGNNNNLRYTVLSMAKQEGTKASWWRWKGEWKNALKLSI